MITFNSCWVGNQLLPIANACINSFGAHGFGYRLYTYGSVRDVPHFVERCDGNALVPAERVFVAHGGLETFADLFAYRFLQSEGGWWVDNDVVCNTSTPPDVEMAFAEERPGVINNAVLKFPPAHRAIAELLEHIAGVDAMNSAWGSTGPVALTAMLQKHEIAGLARPTEDFYPLHWREAAKLLFPEFRDEILARTAHSPFIHLWGAALRELHFDFRHWRPLRGSYLDLVYAKYLDTEVASALKPMDERAFRKSVKAYVEENWQVSLPLAR